jgi:hypothetical protein
MINDVLRTLLVSCTRKPDFPKVETAELARIWSPSLLTVPPHLRTTDLAELAENVTLYSISMFGARDFGHVPRRGVRCIRNIVKSI